MSAVRSAVSISAGRAPDLGGHDARLAAIAVAIPERDVHGGIELTEHLGRDIEPRQDAGRLDHDRAVAADVAGHRRLGRDVAPPEILRERATNDLAIDRRIERFERYGSHSGRSRRALRRCQFDVDLQHFGHERVDLLNLPRGAQVLLDVGQELELVLGRAHDDARDGRS